MTHTNVDRKLKRKRRVSANIAGTNDRPRISIFRSNRYIYAQAIDDKAAKTIVSCSALAMKAKGTKSEQAREVGKKLAALLKDLKIQKAIFDRSRFAYNGRVKAIAEGLREGEIRV